MIAGGTFSVSVTGGVASKVTVECQSQNPPDFIIARSITGWGEATDAQAIEWWWERSMAQDSARGILQSSDASNPAMTSKVLASNAIRTYDTANPPTYAELATTSMLATGGQFVVSMTSTGSIQVGDFVRVTTMLNANQISGYTFQVTAVTPNVSITLGYMATGGITFAVNGGAGSLIKYIPNRMYPRWQYIANITQDSQATVYFTAKNDFTPGEIVSFRVNSEFGMIEINNKQARVLSVTNSATESSIVIDLDTSGYTAFDFPTTAQAEDGFSPCVCVPSSSGVVPLNGSATVAQQPAGTNLLDAFDNRNVRLIEFGAGLFNISSFVSDDGDVWSWQAYKYDQYNQN